MASYPSAKVHRHNRRTLGRGQYVAATGTPVALTSSGSTVTMTFSKPVIVSGTIPLQVNGLTLVSQQITGNNTVTQTWSGAVATHAYNLPAGAANVATYQGGGTFGASGTF